ncbi:hypothetical protein [Campylobacter pinnipediorum]|uniref:hypothetical protein n=1 Tax=Campylobacter pinnipediorum TaxID=1965231 RepID=UPI00084DF232|nr:hypothetical protein [Campylobacter pinnipediorum]AQW85116.1 hypothetical protein CPIN17262_1451 [Campylobacter pinnipediorum subsp. pinnipediorum]
MGGLIDEDKGANLGYHIYTSVQLNNRQLHQEEIKFIQENTKDYAKTNNMSEEKAKDTPEY